MTIKTRIQKLETETAAQVRPIGGWAIFWATLRLCYGDHKHYSAEELIALDSVDPEPMFSQTIERVYAERAAMKKAKADELADKG